MQTIFKSAELQQAFDEKGYVIARNVIVPELINAIQEVYASTNEEALINIGSVNVSKAYQTKILHQKLIDTCQAYLEKINTDILINYQIQPNLISLVSKHPKQGVVGLHRHPFLVDIRYHKLLVFWIPLMDVDETNGALRMLPNTYTDYVYKFDNTLLEERSEVVKLQKGDAVIFDNRLQHWSDDNFSNENRQAFVFGASPISAQLVHHHIHEKDDKIHVELYKLSKKNYIEPQELGAKPEHLVNVPPFDSFVYKTAPITTSETTAIEASTESKTTPKTGWQYELWRKLPASVRKRFFDIIRG